jgi:hypothetical protein
MSTGQLAQITEPDFTAVARVENGAINVRLSGTADLNVKKQLDDFLSAVHGHAGGTAVGEVQMDLRTLEFMNSSCLKALVSWISAVQDQVEQSRYRITFISNPDLHWQRRSLHALSRIAGDIVQIHT